MTTEKKIEILYDHYKETFVNQKEYLQKRNYYTFICLGLILSLSFQISNPDQSNIISNELIKNNIGNIKIDFNYINNVLTFTLLWVVIMYYQINFLIEKRYKYIHEIEENLTKALNPFEITREKKTYLDNYPWLSEVVDKIYTIIFPIVLISIAIIKWRIEMKTIPTFIENGHFYFDSIFLLGIILTSFLYLTNRHFNDFRKK
jgi:hypothetical protein